MNEVASLVLLAGIAEEEGSLIDIGGVVLDGIRSTVPDGVVADLVSPTTSGTRHGGFRLSAPDPRALSTWLGQSSSGDAIAALRNAGGGPVTIITQGAGPIAEFPVSYVVTYDVPTANQAQFQAWQPQIIAAHLAAEGFVSAEYHPSTDDATSWTVLVRFASEDDLAAWRGSQVRAELIGRLEGIAQDLAVRGTGLSWAGWFPEPQAPTRPVRWKQAMATVMPLYPTVMLLTTHLAPRLGASGWGWPGWIVTFVVVSTAVCTLTWVLMPTVTRILRPWLLPGPDEPAREAQIRGLAVVVMIAALLTAFALTT